MSELVRLQKFMSHQGLGSRRKCEEYITSGFVTVNGKLAIIGQKIDPEKDKVFIDRQQVSNCEKKYKYYVLNKPRGYISSLKQTDSNSPLAVSLLHQEDDRVYNVGRLDKESSGLLLFSNDGDFTYKITHPSYEKEKEYLVKARDPITEGMIKKFENGLRIDGVKTKPATVKRIDTYQIKLIIKEGRNRQIRKMFSKVGNNVLMLHRTRINNLQLGSLKFGEYRELTDEDLKLLME